MSPQASRWVWSFFILVLICTAGCSMTRRSWIILDASHTTPGGMVILNFSNDEVDEYIRAFVLQKGYEIAFAEGSKDWADEELPDDCSSLIWLAEKPGKPTILFSSGEGKLIVSFLQKGLFPSAELKDSVNVLYRVLAAKFGGQNVRMAE